MDGYKNKKINEKVVATLSRFGNQLTKLIINLDHCQRYEIS